MCPVNDKRDVSDMASVVSSRLLFFFSRRKWLPPPLRKLSQGKVEKSPPTTTPTATPTAATTSTAVSIVSTSSDRSSLKKNVSEKRFKLPSGAEQSRPSRAASVSISALTTATASMRVSASETEADLDAELQPGIEGAEEEEGETEQSEPEMEEDAVPEPDDVEALTYSEQNGADDAEDELELPPPMKPITEPILVATANGSSASAITTETCGKSRVSFIFSFFFFFLLLPLLPIFFSLFYFFCLSSFSTFLILSQFQFH